MREKCTDVITSVEDKHSKKILFVHAQAIVSMHK